VTLKVRRKIFGSGSARRLHFNETTSLAKRDQQVGAQRVTKLFVEIDNGQPCIDQDRSNRVNEFRSGAVENPFADRRSSVASTAQTFRGCDSDPVVLAVDPFEFVGGTTFGPRQQRWINSEFRGAELP
jgi:hypothetical protein